MKTATTMPAARMRALARTRTAIAAVAAALLCTAIVIPATADEHDNGRRDEHHAKQEPRRAEGHRDQRRESHGYGYNNYYPQPVYVPPVVTYVEPQSPGISLFVPLNLHFH